MAQPETQNTPPPTSSIVFSLPSTSSSPATSPLFVPDADPTSPLILQRFRRPSLLPPKNLSDSRLTSPLAKSFSLPPTRPHSASAEDRMWTDRSPSTSSDNATPPLQASQSEKESGNESDANPLKRKPSYTLIRAPSSTVEMRQDGSTRTRRLTAPPKLPRIQSLAKETRPDENEVKSEAQFQRLVASFAALPTQPRTPRALCDRGRYPEEVGEDSLQNESASDGDDEDESEPDYAFAYAPPKSAPITIVNLRTPAASASGSVNGDDEISNGVASMDVDVPPPVNASPSVSLASVSSMTNLHQWRYTPPPTASAVVRTNKRKYDDRFDPYPATKRRAVSPSVSSLRESHPSLSPIYIPRSRAVPPAGSLPGSVASSPTVSHSNSFRHSMSSVASSPTLRASMGLASPIGRPLRLSGRRGDEEREVKGAGDAVSGLTLE